jgi:hypothetical protein
MCDWRVGGAFLRHFVLARQVETNSPSSQLMSIDSRINGQLVEIAPKGRKGLMPDQGVGV